jgi:chromosome partitioning protein
MGIAFVHHKGGVGKTTSCINIAGWLAKLGKKVLVVDLDPQGSATTGLGVDRQSVTGSIYDVFCDSMSINETILEAESGVFLLPSTLDLLDTKRQISGRMENAYLLKEKLKPIEYLFDFILIDVPPGLTSFMINGIVAAKNIIIPLESGIFAYEALDTLKNSIVKLNNELKIETNVMMILLRGYSNSIMDRHPTQEIKQLLAKFIENNLTSDVKVYAMPFSKKIYQSQMAGMPISHFASWSEIGRTYKKITQEILNYY